MKQNKLSYAQSTISTLKTRELTEEQSSELVSLTEQLDRIKRSGKRFVTKDVIRSDNRGVQGLLHNDFNLQDVEGDIAELRIHCDRGYVGFIFEPDTMYKIRDEWSNCSLVLIGTSGTTYTLEQGLN